MKSLSVRKCRIDFHIPHWMNCVVLQDFCGTGRSSLQWQKGLGPVPMASFDWLSQCKGPSITTNRKPQNLWKKQYKYLAEVLFTASIWKQIEDIARMTFTFSFLEARHVTEYLCPGRLISQYTGGDYCVASFIILTGFLQIQGFATFDMKCWLSALCADTGMKVRVCNMSLHTHVC